PPPSVVPCTSPSVQTTMPTVLPRPAKSTMPASQGAASPPGPWIVFRSAGCTYQEPPSSASISCQTSPAELVIGKLGSQPSPPPIANMVASSSAFSRTIGVNPGSTVSQDSPPLLVVSSEAPSSHEPKVARQA